MKTHTIKRMRTSLILSLLPIIGIIHCGCEPDKNPYDLHPTLWIEEPTAAPEYTTPDSTVTIGGVVELGEDEVFLTNLRTEREYVAAIIFESEAREFTWTFHGIVLEPGENRIQVRATFYGSSSYAYLTVHRIP